MTKPNDYDDDTDDDTDHKNDSYTAAGAAPGASVHCSSFQLPASGFRLPASGPVWLPVQLPVQASGFQFGFRPPASTSGFWLLVWLPASGFWSGPASGPGARNFFFRTAPREPIAKKSTF